MRKLTTILLLALAALSCQAEKQNPWDEDWDKPDQPDKPQPVATAKPRYVWIDAAANFDDYGNSRDRIREDCKRIAQTGFTDIIVDVRPTTGDVLFTSSVAPALRRIDRWKGSSYGWAERTADFDYLQAFIEEGHAAGLKVHAAMNTMVGGYLCPYGLGKEGMVYSDEAKREWCTVQNRPEGLVNCLDIDEYGARFLNPAHKDVQAFVVSLVAELAAYKDLDGIVLDRCRYDDSGLMSDFSETTRKAFEQFCGHSVSPWPSAIFAPGAWYSSYYTSGVNWASPSYNCKTEYLWASADYQAAGYADHLDYIFLGAYAGADHIHGTTEWTMEGFCKLGAKRLASAVPFAAGPDIGNSSGFPEGGKGSLMPDIVKTCIGNADGLFIFDLCHIKMYDYWSSLKTGIDAYLKTVNNQ